MSIAKLTYTTIASLFFLLISLLIMTRIAPLTNDNADMLSMGMGAINALFVVSFGAWMRGKTWV
jgi:hypothetical protein